MWVGWLVGCRFESNCPLVGPGTIGGVPSVGVFLRDPSPYLCEFPFTRKNEIIYRLWPIGPYYLKWVELFKRD